MTNKALQVSKLTAHIGDFTLKQVDLALEQGTIMGLVGKNGAGKTTFIKSVLDMIPRAEGEVHFNGLPLFGNEETVKANIGVVFDTPIYPVHLNPIKVKKLMSPFYRHFDHNKFEQLMKRFELDAKKKISTYSKGMQMKFSIVMALCHDPDLIILDEPTAGLDPVARADMLDLLLEHMQGEDKSILLSTHITSDLDKIADYLTFIDDGKIILSQGKDELLDKYALVQVEKEAMNEMLKAELWGLKETAFGFVGLARKNKFATVENVKMVRPTVEDVIVYLSGAQNND